MSEVGIKPQRPRPSRDLTSYSDPHRLRIGEPGGDRVRVGGRNSRQVGRDDGRVGDPSSPQTARTCAQASCHACKVCATSATVGQATTMRASAGHACSATPTAVIVLPVPHAAMIWPRPPHANAADAVRPLAPASLGRPAPWPLDCPCPPTFAMSLACAAAPRARRPSP
jgi:hypothetical protein